MNLKELLNYENQNSEKYQKLIERLSKRRERIPKLRIPDLYSEIPQETVDILSSKLEGEILIDLGSGNKDSLERFIPFALKLGVSSYVGVDKIYSTSLDPLTDVSDRFENIYPVSDKEKITLANADLLDFVSRLPDNSCSFVMNQMATFMLKYEMQYISALVTEMKRATKGIIFGYATEIFNALEKSPDKHDIIKIDGKPLLIYEKVR